MSVIEYSAIDADHIDSLIASIAGSISCDENKWADALCAHTDPELFFPGPGEPNTKAKKLCAQCPLQAECLENALETREPHGIWGGYNPTERQRILEARRETAAHAA